MFLFFPPVNLLLSHAHWYAADKGMMGISHIDFWRTTNMTTFNEPLVIEYMVINGDKAKGEKARMEDR